MLFFCISNTSTCMWPQHMAFICCDPIVLLQIMQVRWGFPRLLFEELCLMGYGEDTLDQNGCWSDENSSWGAQLGR